MDLASVSDRAREILENFQAQLLQAGGEPELVVVDARTLRLLMGDLAELIILRPFQQPVSALGGSGTADDPFVWDDDSPCD